MEELKKSSLIVSYPDTKENSSHVLNKSGSKDPVILIFGWLGAEDRYLKVYSRIYEEKGFPTIRLTVSPLIVLFKYAEMRTYCEKLMDILEEPQFVDRPVIIHLFSNGGAFQYEIFSETLQKDQEKNKLVKGVIFDSGPTRINFSNNALVSAFIIGTVIKNKFLVYSITSISSVCTMFLRGIRIIQRDFFRMPVYLMDPYNNLKKQENLCPQLFIYSKADRLVSYKELEVFIESRKAIGVDVTTRLYENTPHVKHFPSNKLDYCETVFKFINKVLKK